MVSKYVVFMNSRSGMKWIPELGGDVFEKVVQNIENGCDEYPIPRQDYMYYIYKRYEMGAPLHGTKYDIYKYYDTVPGSAVEKPRIGNMTYALTHQTSSAWFFTDNMFKNCD